MSKLLSKDDHHHDHHGGHKEYDMYREYDYYVHKWGMTIDLDKCTGCGACVVACYAENNIPVVGKEQVANGRHMSWLTLERFQDEIKDESTGITRIDTRVLPQLCQHCENAPCEPVCPVFATYHNPEGINLMVYSRCVGTRYCSNNCSYKVRRFNWFAYAENDEFDYNMNNDLGRMVLNPDVNVRGRGVMEKCSLCIQMTQKTILDAKKDGRRVVDGEFQTACSNACSDGAIVFGDINDKDSKISELNQKDRAYRLLESIGTKPNVLYQVKVTNSKKV